MIPNYFFLFNNQWQTILKHNQWRIIGGTFIKCVNKHGGDDIEHPINQSGDPKESYHKLAIQSLKLENPRKINKIQFENNKNQPKFEILIHLLQVR